MCGIAGGVSSVSNPRLSAAVGPMTRALQHRGPDEEGIWANEFCALGNRRLAIIDLSPAGRQPLSNESSSVWVTFNGEIYNFQALREELEGFGHRFRTGTDTEVIVHAYEQWGTGCVKRFRGMFAFALWDQQRRQLFLARDRVGKKPVLYTQVGNVFLFSSELQSLLQYPDIRREPELSAIDAYLSYGYVPAPQTAFRGVNKLPPAHWLTLDVSRGRPVLRVEQYWKLEYSPKSRLSEAEAAEQLRQKLTEAVKLRMISDVPLGVFLSGGLDSSVVVGLMAGLSPQPVKTFSIGFKEAGWSELGFARNVAQRWATDHHEFVVEPDALVILPRLVRHYGEPFADSSAVPTFYVSQVTRRSVTVALNGDGGDESFAGYNRYFANLVAERLSRVPGARNAMVLLQMLLPDSSNQKNRLRYIHRFLGAVAGSTPERYQEWVGIFSQRQKQGLLGGDFRPDGAEENTDQLLRHLFAASRQLHPIDAAMAVDVASYLPYDLLAKVDITSMANSLEARSPFLDHEVMEFAARLPIHFKRRRRISKYLVKRAFADLLPRENLRRGKMGFGVPVGEWFRGSLREFLQDMILSERSRQRGYFNPQAVQALLENHVARKADHGTQLWALLMLEMWHREFLDNHRGREVGTLPDPRVVRTP